jgi:hypothetical protein
VVGDLRREACEGRREDKGCWGVRGERAPRRV